MKQPPKFVDVRADDLIKEAREQHQIWVTNLLDARKKAQADGIAMSPVEEVVEMAYGLQQFVGLESMSLIYALLVQDDMNKADEQ